MADELIDILKNDLSVIKTCLKSDAHKNGWLHASVHIWFYTEDGKILFQKRSNTKIAFPNLWDISVAGHISAGENAISSALRETEEEIGLKISENDLVKIGDFTEKHQHTADFIDHEIHYIYTSKLNVKLEALKIQKEELSDLQLISIEDFKSERLKSDFEDKFVAHDPKYYDFILAKIEQQLNNS